MNRTQLKDELSVFVDQLRNDEKAKNTVHAYKRNISMFIESIKHDNPINKEDVISFKEKISSEGYKSSSLNQIVISVNKYLRWLKLEKMVVKKFKTQTKSSLETVLTNKDFARLQRFAKAMGYEDIYLVLEVLVTTGIRISELTFFTVENLKSFYIEVHNKGKMGDIILTQQLKRRLVNYAKEKRIKSGPIFELNDRQIRYRLKKIAGRARVNKSIVYPHNIRHLFALNWIENGGSLADLKDILRHLDIKTTAIYLQTSKENKRKKLENMRGK